MRPASARTAQADWRAVIADLAAVNHWALADLKRLPLSELRAYHALAVERAKALFAEASAPRQRPFY